MNGDLISRKAVLEALRMRGRELQNLSVTSFEKAISLGVAYECVGIVKEALAVDAEPVRHAKWEGYPNRAHIRCTCCRVEFEKEKMPMRRAYCPNCGAKMDKEENT